jgi:hypothetical protein
MSYFVVPGLFGLLGVLLAVAGVGLLTNPCMYCLILLNVGAIYAAGYFGNYSRGD